MRRLLTIYWRAIRLRCPDCGQGRLFAGYFRMHPECSSCGLRFEREPGYFLGSIYVNYGVTTIVTGLWYTTAAFVYHVPPGRLLAPLATFCVLFPLWFFRYARAIWLGFDHFYDPSGGRK